MNQIIGTLFYAGLYRAYVEVVNQHGLKKNSKRIGNWQKAVTFPYMDYWTITHLIWGGLGAAIGLNQLTMLTLASINEFIYEPYRCYAYAQGNKSIHYAQYCDPFPHKVADAIYTMAGYYTAKMLPKLTHSQQ